MGRREIDKICLIPLVDVTLMNILTLRNVKKYFRNKYYTQCYYDITDVNVNLYAMVSGEFF